jgi:hypothetical protein
MKFDNIVIQLLEDFNVGPLNVNANRPTPNNGPTTSTMTTKGVTGFPNQGMQTVSVNLPGKNKPRRRRKLRNKIVR